MGKNIIIFSDGTGQRGGLLFDEKRSNIYKLYRATRCAPDSCVSPAAQLAYYDPGIGTLPAGIGALGAIWRMFSNSVSQALGLGLTRNIIDCYAAVIRMWRPGDRIFLFGFSRGAYTIRCLGAVIASCGVPTRMNNDHPLKLDEGTSKTIARRAVKTVYQHTSSWAQDEHITPRQRELLDQRAELSKNFRKRYKSGDDQGANIYPHFIGVFETVASLSNPFALAGLIVFGALVTAAVSLVLWYFLSPVWIFTAWWRWFITLACIIGGVAYSANLVSRIKSEIGVPRKYPWRFFHFAERRMNFYDTQLNKNVGYARHALAIDEARTSFQRVPWGDQKTLRDTGTGNPPWFEQLWFSGNHSDIGGSYPENESRLSDVALKWVLDAAVSVGMEYDPSVLQVYSDPTGPQHDETKASVFRFAGKLPRRIGDDFPLHDSVLERFASRDVLNYDTMGPYRPVNLKTHGRVQKYYT